MEEGEMSKAWHARGGSTTRWRNLRAYVLRRDGYVCRVGLPGCTGKAPLLGGHVDHIIPKENGGEDTETNLRASCQHCNLSRGKARVSDEPPPKRYLKW
jgi:5-methylcytosine-specific restriction endonuclease McrA